MFENQLYQGNTGEGTLFFLHAINERNIPAHSEFHNEDEILLLAGTYMAMQSQVSPTPYLPVIHLKQKIPLLQLQFEGILNVSNLLF